VTDDKGATGEDIIDVDVYNGGTIPLSIGYSLFGYWDPTLSDSYLQNTADQITAKGIEWVEIAVYGLIPSQTSNEVEVFDGWNSGRTLYTLPDAYLRHLISTFTSRGVRVFLRPTLEFPNWATYRGLLAPTNWTAWFASYGEFIQKYAAIAKETGVSLFAVGTELKNANSHTAEWRPLIAKVRSVASGIALTYCDGEIAWDPALSEVRFWDALDYIGVDFWEPITGKGDFWNTGYPGEDDPAPEIYSQRMRTLFAQGIGAIQRQYGKPIVLTESGCGSWDGANRTPAYSPRYMGPTDVAVDFAEQLLYLETLNKEASAAGYVRIVFNYAHELKADLNYQKEDWPFEASPKGKPADEMFDYWAR
jgi:hypothetical protein